MDILCFFRPITTVGIACFTRVRSIFSTLDCWHCCIPRFVYCCLLTCLLNYWHSDTELCSKFQLVLTWTFFSSQHIACICFLIQYLDINDINDWNLGLKWFLNVWGTGNMSKKNPRSYWHLLNLDPFSAASDFNIHKAHNNKQMPRVSKACSSSAGFSWLVRHKILRGQKNISAREKDCWKWSKSGVW